MQIRSLKIGNNWWNSNHRWILKDFSNKRVKKKKRNLYYDSINVDLRRRSTGKIEEYVSGRYIYSA